MLTNKINNPKVKKQTMCGGGKNVVQEHFNKVTLPAYRYAYLHIHACKYNHTEYTQKNHKWRSAAMQIS